MKKEYVKGPCYYSDFQDKKMAKCKICKLEFLKDTGILLEIRDLDAKEAAKYFSWYCLLSIINNIYLNIMAKIYLNININVPII